MKQSRSECCGAERGAGAIDQHTPHEQRDFYYDTVAASAFPVMSMRFTGAVLVDRTSGRRMRSAVLLVLLLTLISTDASPCQEWNNNGYYKFEHKHILSDTFDTNSLDAWTDYITKKGLCDRPLQSFLEQDDEERVKGICNGRGITYRGIRDNLCISTDTFSVYIVQSKRGKCEVYSVEQIERYVVVACDIDGNQCLPVHYETQTNEPPRGREICQPPTYEYSGDKEWLPFRKAEK